jgi:hypothetical protein
MSTRQRNKTLQADSAHGDDIACNFSGTKFRISSKHNLWSQTDLQQLESYQAAHVGRFPARILIPARDIPLDERTESKKRHTPHSGAWTHRQWSSSPWISLCMFLGAPFSRLSLTRTSWTRNSSCFCYSCLQLVRFGTKSSWNFTHEESSQTTLTNCLRQRK